MSFHLLSINFCIAFYLACGWCVCYSCFWPFQIFGILPIRIIRCRDDICNGGKAHLRSNRMRARERKKGKQRIEEATSKYSESWIPCKTKVGRIVKKREFKNPISISTKRCKNKQLVEWFFPGVVWDCVHPRRHLMYIFISMV